MEASSPNAATLRKNNPLMAAADQVIDSLGVPFTDRVRSARHEHKEDIIKSGNTLDECKKLKSGYDLKNQQTIKKLTFWPHAFLSDMSALTDTLPDNISLDAFVLGFIRILLSDDGCIGGETSTNGSFADHYAF